MTKAGAGIYESRCRLRCCQLPYHLPPPRAEKRVWRLTKCDRHLWATSADILRVLLVQKYRLSILV